MNKAALALHVAVFMLASTVQVGKKAPRTTDRDFRVVLPTCLGPRKATTGIWARDCLSLLSRCRNIILQRYAKTCNLKVKISNCMETDISCVTGLSDKTL